jgi:glycosyltransferase involved in cell wall biosynthesis
MISKMLETTSGSPVLTARGLALDRPTRVAVICDFLEEKWPSMDLNGDLLYRFLARDHASQIAAVQVRPIFHQRLMRVPLLAESLAWNVDRLANRFVDYPRWMRRHLGDFDLFHLVDHSYSQLVHSLPPDRTIVTCHDLDTFRCLLEPAQEQRPRWFRAMAQRVLDGFRQAAHVITNSQATRDQLLRYELFPAEKITVIHSGVHPAFGSLADPAADVEAARLLGPDNEIRLLSVGSTIPRKRMDVLLRVLAAVKEDFPAVKLLRVGGAFTEAQRQLAEELNVEGSVLVLPFLSREVLASIYRQATLLLQPSEAEGFGMPIAEAMACGCPVLASDLAALREIGGAACSYCAVGDVEGWKRAVAALLREDIEDKAENNAGSAARRQHALAQAARYTWAENARQTVPVYNHVLSSSAKPAGANA